MIGVLNHLWQSTLFAILAGLLTLTLKRNSARTRYWVWFAASAESVDAVRAARPACRKVSLV